VIGPAPRLPTRREVLRLALAAAAACGPVHVPHTVPNGLRIRLVPRDGASGRQVVSFGLPLPPDLVDDPRRVALEDEDGRPIASSVRVIEPWRAPAGGARSVLVQLALDFGRGRARHVYVAFDRAPDTSIEPLAAVPDTLVTTDGLAGPRVLALLPAGWLCASGLVGLQVAAEDAGRLAAYDEYVERSFEGSLACLASERFADWQYDRPTCWYTMYARTGAQKYAEAAYRAASFMRTHTRTEGPHAGTFSLKDEPDMKYVYPRAMHIHYLLTGDERARAAGEHMARYCLANTEPVYNPSRLRPVAAGADPEKERAFWTPREQGYGLLGIVHGWELTGDRAYLEKARTCVDAYERHQRQPPDGHPPDGSFRQDWGLYDPSESSLPGATSAWMTAILLDALFHYHALTGEPRVAEMVLAWCDFLDARGFPPDGSKAFYVIDCLAPPGQPAGVLGDDMEQHNLEMAYMFGMGIYFSRDPRRTQAYAKRFERLFPLALAVDATRPQRAYGWMFQASSRLVYFLAHPGEGGRIARR
jgi:hypothetical protein